MRYFLILALFAIGGCSEQRDAEYDFLHVVVSAVRCRLELNTRKGHETE